MQEGHSWILQLMHVGMAIRLQSSYPTEESRPVDQNAALDAQKGLLLIRKVLQLYADGTCSLSTTI